MFSDSTEFSQILTQLFDISKGGEGEVGSFRCRRQARGVLLKLYRVSKEATKTPDPSIGSLGYSYMLG